MKRNNKFDTEAINGVTYAQRMKNRAGNMSECKKGKV